MFNKARTKPTAVSPFYISQRTFEGTNLRFHSRLLPFLHSDTISGPQRTFPLFIIREKPVFLGGFFLIWVTAAVLLLLDLQLHSEIFAWIGSLHYHFSDLIIRFWISLHPSGQKVIRSL